MYIAGGVHRMKLKVMKCYDKGSFRVRVAMGLQMRLTIAPARFLSTWELSYQLAKHPYDIQPSMQSTGHQAEVKSQQHLKIYCYSFRKYINSLEILNPTETHVNLKNSLGTFPSFL